MQLPNQGELWENYHGINALQLDDSSSRERYQLAFNILSLLTIIEGFQSIPQEIKYIFQDGYLGCGDITCLPSHNKSDLFEGKIFHDVRKLLQQTYPIHIDYIIFIKCSPQTCFQRLTNCDITYSLDDLIFLDAQYDQWLVCHPSFNTSRIIILDGERINTLVDQLETHLNVLAD